MYFVRQSNRFETALIWLGGYLFIDFIAVYFVKLIVNLIVDNYYFKELLFNFGLLIYRPEVTQYCTAIKDAIIIFGTFIFIIWKLYDNPAFREDKKYMSRSVCEVVKDTCYHIIWTCIGLTVVGVVYHFVNIMANSTM